MLHDGCAYQEKALGFGKSFSPHKARATLFVLVLALGTGCPMLAFQHQ